MMNDFDIETTNSDRPPHRTSTSYAHDKAKILAQRVNLGQESPQLASLGHQMLADVFISSITYNVASTLNIDLPEVTLYIAPDNAHGIRTAAGVDPFTAPFDPSPTCTSGGVATGHLCDKGVVTHGHMPEAGNYGGQLVGLPHRLAVELEDHISRLNAGTFSGATLLDARYQCGRCAATIRRIMDEALGACPAAGGCCGNGEGA